MTKCDFCKKNKATMTFSNDIMSYAHGFSKGICTKCYIQINLEKAQDCIKVCLERLKEMEK